MTGTGGTGEAEQLLAGCQDLLDAVLKEGGDSADLQAVASTVGSAQAFADGTYSERTGTATSTGLRVRAAGGAASLLLGAPPADPRETARLAVALARASRGGDLSDPLAPGRAVHPLPPGPAPDTAADRELLGGLLAPADGPVALGAEHVGTRSWTVVCDTAGTAVAHERVEHHLWHWLEGIGGHMVDGLVAPGPEGLRPQVLRERAEAFRAVHRAGPRAEPPDGPLPVLLHPEVAAHLARSLGFLFCAGNVLSGMRPLLSRVGRRIAAPHVTLTDDPCDPVDAEANPTSRQILLENGTLRGFLTGRASAAALGITPSGAARRAAPDRAVVESPSRIALAPGTASRAELRSRLDDGIEAVCVMQPGRIRGRRGTFTTVVLGWRIRGGRRTHAVGPVRISLGVFELLRSVGAVGDDPACSFLAAGATAPSVLVDRMEVG